MVDSHRNKKVSSRRRLPGWLLERIARTVGEGFVLPVFKAARARFQRGSGPS